MSTIIIATTVNIVVTEEASEEEERSMGAAVTAGKDFTIILIVGTTQIIRAKFYHVVRKMEGTNSKETGLVSTDDIEVLLCQTATEDSKGENEDDHGA